VARFAAQRYRFPGVEIKARLFRNYPWGELASHVVGYIGRINQSERRTMEDWSTRTRATTAAPSTSASWAWSRASRQLHGITGVEQVETSAGGRAVRKLASIPSTPGNTVMLSIDIKLQKLVEDMFGERRGALVALDPKTGEVLAFVSKPTFDPNLFVDGIDAESWQMLNESIDKPLLNRALRGTYPPGSTYKPFMAHGGAADRQAQSATTIINDAGSWNFGGHVFRSHGDHGLGPVDMHTSIVKSSNVYYYSLANEMGVDAMHDFMKPLGFGQITGIDIQGESRGVLPSQEWKRNYYKRRSRRSGMPARPSRWASARATTPSPCCSWRRPRPSLANNGIKHKPQLVIATQDSAHAAHPGAGRPPVDLGYKPENVAVVRKALVGVTQEGTSARVFAGAGYLSGGKTGTAQAVTIGAERQIQRHQAGGAPARPCLVHGLFAPADDPKIALA
jgi:penicillin-binding protein 2